MENLILQLVALVTPMITATIKRLKPDLSLPTDAEIHATLAANIAEGLRTGRAWDAGHKP